MGFSLVAASRSYSLVVVHGLLIVVVLLVDSLPLSHQGSPRSCFLIHSASLCLLGGAFNPFTFKVIINMHVLNCCLVNCFGFGFIGHFFLFLFFSLLTTPVFLPGEFHRQRCLGLQSQRVGHDQVANILSLAI